MKKLSLLLIPILILFGCSAKGKYKPGTYEASATGYNEEVPITLSVQINDEGDIENVLVHKQDEAPELGGLALDTLVGYAIEENSSEIDTVTGATLTSEGFIQALDEALKAAK